VKHILTSIGKNSAQHDPIIHFYETFLTEYNPALRKSRGVWYTPKPVVSFMVRAVDDILKTHFGLSDGLADTSKTTIKTMQRVLVNKKEKRFEDKLVEKEVHRVQLLDPATGTGTFLAEVIRYIYQNNFEGMQGIWNNYVENDLIPRLNGFELMMASYAIAHLKLDLLLTETGYTPQDTKKDQRFKVFLTRVC
ncbi:MAG: DNA methyltransferase, partial [Bacteroidetes bacterium HGW-Bacteroidetes-23]